MHVYILLLYYNKHRDFTKKKKSRSNKYKNHFIKNEESSRDGGAKSIETRVAV